MKKQTTNEQPTENLVMLSGRVNKTSAKKLRVYLVKNEKKMMEWLEEKISELPEEEEHRRYHHRKVG